VGGPAASVAVGSGVGAAGVGVAAGPTGTRRVGVALGDGTTSAVGLGKGSSDGDGPGTGKGRGGRMLKGNSCRASTNAATTVNPMQPTATSPLRAGRRNRGPAFCGGVGGVAGALLAMIPGALFFFGQVGA